LQLEQPEHVARRGVAPLLAEPAIARIFRLPAIAPPQMLREPQAPDAAADRDERAIRGEAGAERGDEHGYAAERRGPDGVDHCGVAGMQLFDPYRRERQEQTDESEQGNGDGGHTGSEDAMSSIYGAVGGTDAAGRMQRGSAVSGRGG
jgi:hypothetical protein